MTDDDLDLYSRQWQRESGLPVASDAARTAARKKTWRSERAKKRIGRASNGIHKRKRKGLR